MLFRRLFLILVVILGCSKNNDGSGGSTSQVTPVKDVVEVGDVQNVDTRAVIEDVESVEEVENPPEDVYEEPDTYEKDCLREVYYYCPPLHETWRAVAIVDICNGDKIIEMGPCKLILECDPTYDVENRECVTDDGLEGTQEVYCNKGYYEYGECIPCGGEICDGIDNDCDGAIDEGAFQCFSECGEGKGVCIDGEVVECDAPLPEKEICDYLDNDCDGDIDEDVTNACGNCEIIPEEVCDYYDNDCDGDIDEFQLNACGECGIVPEEICDDIDNDCNGKTDEGLIEECSTACETNISYCINGHWNCTAKAPQEEICNGLDDDCDGLVDEELNCLCTVADVGKLLPCKENPLKCGEGYKTCQCIGGDCDAGFEMSECLAPCYWMPYLLPPNAVCDPYKGLIVAEECNNHDDNCNDLIDEGLSVVCYSGPPETMDVGICLPGEMICEDGYWGNLDNDGEFVHKLCLGETTPEPEDICDGADANCDGEIDEDKKLEPTDILFIVDMSGSMSAEITAVLSSLNQFAAYYSDADVVKWGLVLVAVYDPSVWYDRMIIASDLTDFETFMNIFSTMNYPVTGGFEMTNDAIYASIINLVGAGIAPYQLYDLNWASWGVVDSIPILNQWKINWRPDAKHVVIVFSDELGQSYLSPKITEKTLIDMIQAADDLAVYAFNTIWAIGLTDGFENLTTAGVGGKWYELKTTTIEMYNNLLEILDETACSSEEN